MQQLVSKTKFSKCLDGYGTILNKGFVPNPSDICSKFLNMICSNDARDTKYCGFVCNEP